MDLAVLLEVVPADAVRELLDFAAVDLLLLLRAALEPGEAMEGKGGGGVSREGGREGGEGQGG